MYAMRYCKYIKLELATSLNYLVYNCNNNTNSILIFNFVFRFTY